MKATCVKPASPLAENAFSPNQSGKLGRFGLSDPRANAAETFRVACDRVPKGEFKFTVCAVSCWGKVSKPLSVATPKA